MTTEKLIEVGFSHRYKPSLKRVDTLSLSYQNLFKPENFISVDLIFNQSGREWRVAGVSFDGEEALSLVKEKLKSYDLKSVIDFVGAIPS